MNNTRHVGLVGVGTMGTQMAVALLAAGTELAVWDLAPEACERGAALGAAVCGSSSEVAGRSEVVLMSLPTPEDVRQVVAATSGLLEGTPPPRVIVDLSTVDPDTTIELAELTEARGVRYVDAPVLGRPAACGKWTLPAGGDKEAIDAVADVLSCFAARIVHVGPHGAGNSLKLLNNLMFGAINAITSECMAGATLVGLNAEVFYTTVLESNAATVSNLFRELGPKIVQEDWSPTFSLALLEKDNRLAVEMLKRAGVTPIVGQAVAELNLKAVLAGLGAEDTAGLFKIVGSGARPPLAP